LNTPLVTVTLCDSLHSGTPPVSVAKSEKVIVTAGGLVTGVPTALLRKPW
jgi:hypothetical protein